MFMNIVLSHLVTPSVLWQLDLTSQEISVLTRLINFWSRPVLPPPPLADRQGSYRASKIPPVGLQCAIEPSSL